MGTKTMDETSSRRDDGANILPIPPALKFPFPSDNLESQGASTGSSVKSSKAQQHATFQAKSSRTFPPATPNKTITNRESRSETAPAEDKPSERRDMRTQKRPRFKIGGRYVGARQTASEGSLSESDEAADSSSSSEDGDVNGVTNRRPSVDTASRGNKKDIHRGAKSSRMGDFSKFAVGNDNFKTRGKVSKTSGRLDITLSEISNAGYIAKALGSTLQHHVKQSPKDEDVNSTPNPPPPSRPKQPTGRPDLWTRLTSFKNPPTVEEKPIPVLNIVVMVIGSRGDIQPFLKIGKLLKERGHRVRIATHPAFKTFVEQDSDLEFFSVGGDPAELMAFMVKNPGLMPSASTVRAGEIGRKRDAMFGMFQGFWRACINATDEEDNIANRKMMGDKHPFVADAIIANPPSFAHIHCAERLGIPLHLMFTFPYSPTQQFPHPLANIKRTNVDTNYTNFISYPLVEMM